MDLRQPSAFHSITNTHNPVLEEHHNYLSVNGYPILDGDYYEILWPDNTITFHKIVIERYIEDEPLEIVDIPCIEIPVNGTTILCSLRKTFGKSEPINVKMRLFENEIKNSFF